MGTLALIIRWAVSLALGCVLFCGLAFVLVNIFGGTTCLLFGLYPHHWIHQSNNTCGMTFNEWLILVPPALPWLIGIPIVIWAFMQD